MMKSKRPLFGILAAGVIVMASPALAEVRDGPNPAVYETISSRIDGDLKSLMKPDGTLDEGSRLRIVAKLSEVVEGKDFLTPSPDADSYRSSLLAQLPKCGMEAIDIPPAGDGSFNIPSDFCNLLLEIVDDAQ